MSGYFLGGRPTLHRVVSVANGLCGTSLQSEFEDAKSSLSLKA